jgi:hypothetical protein
MTNLTKKRLTSIPWRLRSNLAVQLDKNLLAYVVAATAAGVGLIAAHPANAEVVYTPANKQFGPGTYFLDLNHDGIDDFKFVLAHTSECIGCTTGARIRPGSAVNFQLGALKVYGLSSNQVFGEGSVASALRIGAKVGPGGKFPGGQKMVSANDINSYLSDLSARGPWRTAQIGSNTIRNHFVGFKFLIQGEIHFGWARFTVSIKKAAKIAPVLTGYAYETQPNTPISTLIVVPSADSEPEKSGAQPATLGLLAGGADGLAAWRKRAPASID